MKKTELSVFYLLGKTLTNLKRLNEESAFIDALMILGDTGAWMTNFLDETEGLPALKDSREAAAKFSRAVSNTALSDSHLSRFRVLGKDTYYEVWKHYNAFESAFLRESKSLNVFAVTPKSGFDCRILIEEAEKKLPPNLIKVLPEKVIRDLRQAGRCLAFELPTACAYHICRATEGLMLRYYEVLAGHPWTYPNRGWGNYNDQLKVHKAPEAITMRLDEIQRFDRNAYAHPDKEVSLDEAPMISMLCDAVIFLMAQELETARKGTRRKA